MIPAVPHHLRGDDSLLDEPAEEAQRLGGGPGAEAHPLGLEHVSSVGGQDGDQAVRGRLAGHRPAGHDHRAAEAVLRERVACFPQLIPGRRRVEAERLELSPCVPEPARVGKRRDAESLALVPVRPHERLEEVDLVLVAHPVLVHLLECVDEPGGRELGRPHGVEHCQIRREALGDRVRERLMERLERHLDDADLVSVAGGIPNHPCPRAFRRHDHPDLGLVGSAAEPVWIDERPSPPVTEDDALVSELRERPAHRGSAELVTRAELVLGRQPVVRAAVMTTQDLLQEERLQLEVEGDRLLRIDRHRVLDRFQGRTLVAG